MAQRPRPHQILNQMLMDEQWLNLKLTNEGEAWNLITKELTTVIGTSEYTITQPVSNSQYSGKIYFVVRSTDLESLPYVPVPFNDMSHLDYGEMPPVDNSTSIPEQLAVYRTGMQDQTRKVVIQPVPQEVLTYQIYFFTGEIDRLAAAMNKSGLITELSDCLDLKSSLALLPYARWSDDEKKNDAERRTLLAGLKFQYDELKPEVDDYIDNINDDKDFSLGHWNE